MEQPDAEDNLIAYQTAIHSNSIDFDQDPDAFYRPVSIKTNLPDIFLDQDYHDSTMPPKRNNNNNSSSLPRSSLRSVSNPSTTTSATAKSSTIATTRPGLIKERVKQFDQPTTESNHRPRQNGATTLKKPRSSQSHQPLFGEVTEESDNLGYGIPVLKQHKSNLETSLSPTTPTPPHHTPSHLTPSRIPVRRSRRASDSGPLSTISSGSEGGPPSPLKLSSRRYEPQKNTEASTHLTAVIREPPPKLSPPLRSSRPRLPVSSASTAASRARVAERFTRSTSAEKQKTQQPRLPKDFIHVDIAQRRDQVHSKLSRTYHSNTNGLHVYPESPTESTSPGAENSPINVTPPSESEQPNKDAFLRQVMAIRSPNMGQPSEHATADDLLTDVGEGEETIQMFLGETPKLPLEHFVAPPAPEENNTMFSFADGRGSICPDDSVSVIFTRDQPRRPASLRLDTDTVNSNARSQINKVLDEYNDNPPDQDLQDSMDNLTPGMAAHGNWDDELPARYMQANNSGSDLPPRPSTADSRSSRPHSIEEDLLDDQDYRGTAIIYTNGRNDGAPSPMTIHSVTTGSSLTPRQTVVSAVSNDHSRNNSTTHLSPSFTPQPPIALHLNINPGEPVSTPLPTPPKSAPPNPSSSRPPSQEPSSSSQQWNMPASPAPSSRLRRGTIGDDDTAYSQGDRRSKRSATTASLAPPSTPGELDEKEQEAAKLKKLKSRWNVLKELIDTEHVYYHDMTIGVDIFLATAPHVTTLTYEDRRLIFGNIEKIRDLASKLLDSLKKAVHTVYRVPAQNRFQFKRGGSADTSRDSQPETGYKPSEDMHVIMDQDTTVGLVFCQYASEMDRLFKAWMIHSEKSNRRIQQVKKDPQVKLWLDECYENAKDITNAWDLDSLLIKPAQRYMKYPLLLKEILANTPPDHPDHANLVKALGLIETSVAGINEEKRRREIAHELFHQKSTKKESNRLNLKNFAFLKGIGQKPKPNTQPSTNSPTTASSSSNIPDDGYELVRQKFGGHFFQVQIVMRDFEKYLEDLKYYLNRLMQYGYALESTYRIDIISRFPEQESKIHKYVESIMQIQKYAFPEHEQSIQKFVITPVRKLWQLHEKPQVLMYKHRKLKPSYERYLKEKEKDTLNEKTKTEAEQWIALNHVLKDELPQLYTLAAATVQACLKNFVDIQARWDSMWMTKLKDFIEDRDLPIFVENDFNIFCDAIKDEFFHDFDNNDMEVSSLALTSGSLLAAVAAAEKGEGLRWARSETGDSTPVRVSTDARSSYTLNNSSRGSNYNANHSTPNLNLGIPSPNPNSPHRRSFTVSPTVSPLPSEYISPEAFASQYYHETQRPVTTATSSTTPTVGPGSPSGGQSGDRQWFHSDWANSNTPYQPYGAVSMWDHESQERQQRMMDGIALSHNAHQAERLARQYPSVSYYDQIMASQNYHSRHHSAPQTQSITLAPSSPHHATHLATPPVDHSSLPSPRYSGIFHSALPADMADDEAELMPTNEGEPRVLFIVASLFEFHIDSNRREAGYPYLKYVAGEIFEIVGQRGELWLARNQDDRDGTLGWIWEKHFALLPMEPQ